LKIDRIVRKIELIEMKYWSSIYREHHVCNCVWYVYISNYDNFLTAYIIQNMSLKSIICNQARRI